MTGVVVLTGAGVSAESGLATFRAADGLWEKHRIEDVATPEGFARDAGLVHSFYNARRAALKKARPNRAHLALAEFEREHRGDFLLVTQNIDDLHERAGSGNVAHMHGELLKMRCGKCEKVFPIDCGIDAREKCPGCDVAGYLRPDVVWFGEMPYHLPRIERAIANCALFVSAGTSGNVYPAAGFVGAAKSAGAKCVELNLERSANGGWFDEGRYGLASEVVPEFFAARAGTGA